MRRPRRTRKRDSASEPRRWYSRNSSPDTRKPLSTKKRSTATQPPRCHRASRGWHSSPSSRCRPSTSSSAAPRPCGRADRLRVHTPQYLVSLRRPLTLARILEVPIIGMVPASFTDWRVLQPMRWATGGTVLACRMARECGLAINLGGGFHHAGPAAGSGFCAYADTPVALAMLHAEKPFRAALVVDTDAHQGNGTA